MSASDERTETAEMEEGCIEGRPVQREYGKEGTEVR